MAYVLAALAGLAFGAADQYLGSFSALGGWTAAVSGLSAPWLLLPFVAGGGPPGDGPPGPPWPLGTPSARLGGIAVDSRPPQDGPVEPVLPPGLSHAASG